ncbi:MAG: Rne/Rng family ribonuclease [Planctomycetota bacterium]
MSVYVLMNVLDDQEMRVGVIRDGTLEAVIHERTAEDAQHLGDIYKAKVANVERSLDAAFIDLGNGKNGFLHIDDVQHDKKDKPIDKVLKPGQEIVVQITKEAIRDKGPCLTTYISLAGRCLVLVRDNGRNGGISKRVEDPAERRRLKSVVAGLDVPEGFGVIVRTAAEECSDDEIRLDFEYLTRLWKDIDDRSGKVKAPSCLYQEADVILRTLRDQVPGDVESVIIDQEDLYDEARAFAQVFMPEVSKAIKLHREELPIFAYYGVEERLATVFDRKVELPSGGNIVIEQTEALVSIDVNSSRSREGADVAETAVNTNLQAAAVIAEQLKLRDLGGLIIIDFIDMENREHQRLVQLALRKALLGDKARTHVAPMSRFGLVEMTRQRTRPSHRLVSHDDCHYCSGTGVVKTPETFEIECMRALRQELARRSLQRLKIVVPPDMASHVGNIRRKELARMEEESDCRIEVVADPQLHTRIFRISGVTRRRGRGRRRRSDDEPVRPSLLAPLLEQKAKAIAEAKELLKTKPAQLERELREAAAGGLSESSPRQSGHAAASGATNSGIDAGPKRPGSGQSAAAAGPAPVHAPTVWEEAAVLRQLLFTRR